MPVHLQSGTLFGFYFTPVQVEVDIQNGLPRFAIIGLPDTSLQEARDRVTSAIKNSGFSFPRTHVVANLSPAHVRKAGSAFDLPLALGILAADQALPVASVQDTVFFGELGLDGALKPVQGMLPLLLGAMQRGVRRIILPAAHAHEANFCPDIEFRLAHTLADVVFHLRGESLLPVYLPEAQTYDQPSCVEIDFADIAGQEQAKRALTISAAGGHALLLSGPPGSGKTLLSRALGGILPPLTDSEYLEIAMIQSASGSQTHFPRIRPFRAPHHGATAVSLIGGGATLKPGEITFSHRGVLFLDEFSEFSKDVLEHLREPLEHGSITLSRARGSVTYPARFQFIAAMNPCPCGFFGSGTDRCTCLPTQIASYTRTLSGPLLDRIDLHIQVPRLPAQELRAQMSRETSATVRERVTAARALQLKRYAQSGICMNQELTPRLMRSFIVLSEPLETLFQQATERMHLSARGADRVLKVARTIADLALREHITQEDLLEALQYRLPT